MGNNEFGHGVSWCKRNAGQKIKTAISTKRRVDCPRITVIEQLMLKDEGRKLLIVHRYKIIREGGKSLLPNRAEEKHR